MSAATVNETCSCGATFSYTGDDSFLLIAVDRFRKSHAECRTEVSRPSVGEAPKANQEKRRSE